MFISSASGNVSAICFAISVFLNSFNLLETLAYTILDSFKRHEKISSMTVTIHKPNSPLQDNVDDVSVTVSEKF